MNIKKSDGLLTFSNDKKEFLILVSHRGSCLLVQHYNGHNADNEDPQSYERIYFKN